MPAAVADRVVQGRPDGSTGRFQIGAAVDQCLRNIDIVAACGPMQWGLTVPVVRAPVVRISSGADE
jgi:hypothetical protein